LTLIDGMRFSFSWPARGIALANAAPDFKKRPLLIESITAQ
jgi:hypothetical protein